VIDALALLPDATRDVPPARIGRRIDHQHHRRERVKAGQIAHHASHINVDGLHDVVNRPGEQAKDNRRIRPTIREEQTASRTIWRADKLKRVGRVGRRRRCRPRQNQRQNRQDDRQQSQAGARKTSQSCSSGRLSDALVGAHVTQPDTSCASVLRHIAVVNCREDGAGRHDARCYAAVPRQPWHPDRTMDPRPWPSIGERR
jgi:hypothetical protein